MTTRLVAGCMTGTSIDSVDAALVEISGTGLDMRATLRRSASAPLGDLAPRLRKLADQLPMTAGEIAALSREFSLAHVPVLREVAAGARVNLICIHGQTVFHRPPVSWQLLTPGVVAREFGVPIVFDLRAADLAAGGQGAPITPIADWILFRDHDAGDRGSISVVNLGGFCNITRFPAARRREAEADGQPRIEGFDVCACNQLLDAIARERLGVPFDRDGEAAAKGRVVPPAFAAFSTVLSSQAGAHRSLGTGDELKASFQALSLDPNDLVRTAVECIAAMVVGAAQGACIILAGGGANNRALVSAIRDNTTGPVTTTQELGIPVSHRESTCFAILGALCQDRIPITLPRVTHVSAPAPISGSWVLP